MLFRSVAHVTAHRIYDPCAFIAQPRRQFSQRVQATTVRIKNSPCPVAEIAALRSSAQVDQTVAVDRGDTDHAASEDGAVGCLKARQLGEERG